MSLKFVRSSESLAAEQPFAKERTFAGVPAKMGFEVTGFAVDFFTAWDVA